ncbi:MAG TPA: magnesium/cobalt transporter CorA [Acidimicrobiales bacterium]|nr:magnesium/cobalt transporter CorA [Acidimicrobiales bacterium]
MIVDCAVYEAGTRVAAFSDLEAAARAAEEPDAFVWIGLVEPTVAEFDDVSRHFSLHPLAVEDAVHASQRPKLEPYDETLFMVMRPARYVDSDEVIELSQLMIFIGPHFLVTVRHGVNNVAAEVRRAVEADGDRLKWGTKGVLHAFVDRVVDDYVDVLKGLHDDVEDIERQVFSSERANHAERIFKLKREVLEFRAAIEPLDEPLAQLSGGRHLHDAVSELSEYFRDVHDHLLRVAQRVEAIDSLLTSALNANLAQVSMRQNDDMRKISAWVALLAFPTMIAGIFGMNFEHMPELEWLYGYGFALGIMVGGCLFLFRMFKRSGWL